MDQITREQKLFAIAAANALWVISLFFPWYDFGNGAASDAAEAVGISVDTTISGWDVVPSSWIFLIIGVIAAAAALAEAMDYELPAGLPAFPVLAWASSIPAIVTVAIMLEQGNRTWGIFLALIFSLVALAGTGLVWREDR